MEKETSSKKLIGNMVFYALADLVGKGLHFILLPLYTAFLSTADYGIQNMITSFNAVMNYIMLLCLDSAALRFYSEYSQDEKKIKRFYGTAMTIVCGFTVTVITTCLVLNNILQEYVFKGISFVPYVLLGLAILMFNVVFNLHSRMLEARQEGGKVATVSIVSIITSTVVTLIMIGAFKLGALGVLVATLITSIGTVMFAIIDIIKNKMITPCFDKRLAREMLSYSLPLIPHQISGYLAALIGRIFLNTTGSLEVVGVYSIATQFSSIVDTFQDAASRAFRPWLFASLNSNQGVNKQRIRSISDTLMCGYMVIAVGMGLFSQEIILVMTSDDYYGAWKVIPILVVAVSIRSIYYFYFGQCLYYKSIAKYIFIASITANISNVVAAALLVPKIGMYGSAIASIISIIINSGIIYILNLKNGDVGFSLTSLIGRLLVAWLIILIGVVPEYYFDFEGFVFWNTSYKIILFVGYCLYAWLVSRVEIESFAGTSNIIELIKQFKGKRNE